MPALSGFVVHFVLACLRGTVYSATRTVSWNGTSIELHAARVCTCSLGAKVVQEVYAATSCKERRIYVIP